MPLTIESTAALLKERTLSEHREVENLLLPKLEAISSFQDYAAILKTLYGFYHPLQDKIATFISPGDLPHINDRSNTPLILNDLIALQQPIANLEQCTSLPLVQNKKQAFGALYVLEGSALGGRTITKMLQKNSRVPLTGEQLRFFNGYGEQTGTRWMIFLEALNNQTDSSPVLTTATETFTSLKHWIKRTLYHE